MKATTSSHPPKVRFLVPLMFWSTSGSGRLFRVVLPGPPRVGATAAMEHGPNLPGALGEPPARDPPERLAGDVPAHLRVTSLALHELDRHLDDAQSGPHRPEREVGLEDVSQGGNLLERELLERRTPEQAEAGSGVLH